MPSINTPESADFYPQDVRCDKLDVEGTAAFGATIDAVGNIDGASYSVNGVPVSFATAAPLANLVGADNPVPTYFGTARLWTVVPGVGGPPETHNQLDRTFGDLLSVAGLAQVAAGLNAPAVRIFNMAVRFANASNATIVNLIFNGGTAQVFDATLERSTNWDSSEAGVSEASAAKRDAYGVDDTFVVQTDAYDEDFMLYFDIQFIVVEDPYIS